MTSRGIKFWFAGFTSVWFFSSGAFAVTKPVLNDWFALGSGCRAKSDLAGNVRMESLPGESSDNYRVRFSFSDFALNTDKVDPSQKKFGRECAIRLNINPPPGKKIVKIRAKTKVSATKESGPALDMLSELKLGTTSLGVSQRKAEQGERFSMRDEAVDLAAGVGANEQLPQLGCGEPKIIGFDYSWIVTREKSQRGGLRVDLGRDKQLIIEATLANCE